MKKYFCLRLAARKRGVVGGEGGEFKSRIWTFLRISPAQRLVTLSGLQFSKSVKKELNVWRPRVKTEPVGPEWRVGGVEGRGDKLGGGAE